MRKLGIKLPSETANSLLDRYPEKTIIHKDTRIPMFTEVGFIIARTWKKPRC